MRNGTEACLVDEFTRNTTNTIGFVFDAHQGFLEVIDECDLTAGHLAELLALHAHAAIFHGHIAGILKIAAFVLASDESL